MAWHRHRHRRRRRHSVADKSNQCLLLLPANSRQADRPGRLCATQVLGGRLLFSLRALHGSAPAAAPPAPAPSILPPSDRPGVARRVSCRRPCSAALCCEGDTHYRKMIYFRRPLLFPTVPRVPSKIALFPTAQGQPSEITLFPMAHKPPVGNKRISDGWPPRPSEISIFLTVVTPRGPLAAHTANAHTHTRSTLHAAAARTRRRRRRPPSPAIFAGHLRRTFAGHLRRPPAPDAVVPRRPKRRRPAARSAAAPTPAHKRRRPDARTPAPTPAQRAAAAAPRAARARLCPPPPPSG
jgi:hypothetical protein